MLKDINNILFATNLTKNCIPAFDAAVLLSLRFKSKIILLHVIEKAPDSINVRLEGLLGKDRWAQMIRNYENEARQILIGKRSTSKLIQKALETFCTEAGIDDATCGSQSREIVVAEGEVATRIIETTEKYDCGLIILGGHEKMIKTKPLGSTIRSVLKRSSVPVMVVPSPNG